MKNKIEYWVVLSRVEKNIKICTNEKQARKNGVIIFPCENIFQVEEYVDKFEDCINNYFQIKEFLRYLEKNRMHYTEIIQEIKRELKK